MSWDKVDWSETPPKVVAWFVESDGESATWLCMEFNDAWDSWVEETKVAPLFGYAGHPRDSLTLRPKGEKE